MLAAIGWLTWLLLLQPMPHPSDGEQGLGQRSYAQSAYKKIRANSLLAQGQPLVWSLEPQGQSEQAWSKHIASHVHYVAGLDAIADTALQQKQTSWLETIETYRRAEMASYFRQIRTCRWQWPNGSCLQQVAIP